MATTTGRGISTNLEWISVYALTTLTGSRRISALHYETLYYSVKYRVVVVALHTQLNEVSARFGSFLRP